MSKKILVLVLALAPLAHSARGQDVLSGQLQPANGFPATQPSAPAQPAALPGLAASPPTVAGVPRGLASPAPFPGQPAVARGYAVPLGAPAADSKETQAFYKLVAEMRKAKDKEAKEEKRKQLQDMLSGQLDRDLAQREEQLQKIEERAKQLRDQLEARRESKAEMLKLLMMLVENPSAGFGLPDEWMRTLMRSNGGRLPVAQGFPVQLDNPGVPPTLSTHAH